MTPSAHDSIISSFWKSVFYNIAFFLNGLLIFLLFFEEQFLVPSWMEPIGRMHPLVLHFPLVILLLYASWVIITKKPESKHWHPDLSRILLLLGVFTAVIAAFSGFILSKEEGYDAQALAWHKWLGVAISIGSVVWYSFLDYLPPWRISAKLAAGLMVVVLMVGGHLGGNLTHGEDFLTAKLIPQQQSEIKIDIQQALVYDDLVQPILEQKCYSCHNDQKTKGDLRLHTQELLIKGGKSGMLWDTAQADLGLLISRLHLPVDDKKHMPPRGKPQLSDEEVMLLAAWVRSGSRFDLRVADLQATDPIYTYAQKLIGGGRPEEIYDFPAASADQIEKLNTSYRIISPLATESPALMVNFYNRAGFKASDIKDLLPLKEQVVQMDLSKMPVQDADLKLIGSFTELRTLILNFTDLKGGGLAELKGLRKLRELSLSGTRLKLDQLEALKQLPALQTVYVWSTGLSNEEIQKLRSIPNPRFETGFKGDTIILALNPPAIENEETILKRGDLIRIRHQIPGVSIRYTLDGTEPDSIRALEYQKPIRVEKNTTLRTKAYKEGWYGSKEQEKLFIIAGVPIDSVRLVYEPEKQYRAHGAGTLKDGIKSGPSMGSGQWLGYRNSDFETFLYFDKPIQAQSITISMLRKLDSYIFPPTRVEVWGGVEEKSMKLLKVLQPQIPGEKSKDLANESYTAEFPSAQYTCFKVLARPLAKLPKWHRGKGEKAWIFIDEILVN
ncbi:FN3 associated domain-containing protein [Dyadobacter tibetensis]|uniref:FN3 associated domain-containing protein n=1 Tax=Dyadobacter tibetensis TaxID=1211851 RepID=UPI00047132AE|nr:FN3 associated domain-containing protein [Dyadobacter tibetensis]